MKTEIQKRTAYENVLHSNRISYRAAGKHLGCSGEYVRQLATGKRSATGKMGRAFLEMVADLKANRPLNHQPGIAGETAAADRPRSAAAHSSAMGTSI
jgi:hypothetical protein